MKMPMLVCCLFFGLALGMSCPGSKASIHASCQLEATIAGSCADVIAEIQARVGGQPQAWHDPHNNGTYSGLTVSGEQVDVQRLTGDRKYTDKLLLTFTDAANDECSVTSCSESQVTSVGDFSTNYCNSRMLLCGSAEGCKPVKHDLKYSEQKISPSFGAGKDAAACLKV